VTNETLRKIADALLNAPVVAGVDALLEPEDGTTIEPSSNGSHADLTHW
jgi:hypothetical protein